MNQPKVDLLDSMSIDSNQEIITAVFSETEKHILKLNEDYKNLVISDGKTYDSVKKARTEVVANRTSITKVRKAETDKYAVMKSLLIDEEKRLIAMASPLEEQLKETVKAWEKKKADEKAEKDRIEQKRVDHIKDLIDYRFGVDVIHSSTTYDSSSLKLVIEEVESHDTSLDEYQEFCNFALSQKHKCIEMLNKLLKNRLRIEAEDAERKAEDERIATEKARLERLRLELEAKQKKIDDERAEKVKIEIAKEKIAKDKLAEAQKKIDQLEADKKVLSEKIEPKKTKIKTEPFVKGGPGVENKPIKKYVSPSTLSADKERLLKFANETLPNLELPVVKTRHLETLVWEIDGKLKYISEVIINACNIKEG